MGTRRCEALYDYNATDSEELTIRKGEQLAVVNSDGSWWEVTNGRSKTGLVPCNYVKELPQQQAPVAQSSGASGASQFRIHPEEPVGMYQQTDLVKTANGPFLNIPAVAKYRYVSKREDELGLEKGDHLLVLEKEQDGWWRGRCGNQIGWFPFNYVEELPQSIPTEKVEKSVICTVVALYPFNSGNPEELAFSKGDILEIIDQPADDPDWWEARKANGATGLIPRNYVDQIPEGNKPKSPAGAQGGWSGASVTQPSPVMPGMVGCPPPFANEPWYHGKMSRKDAERKLNSEAMDGQFLLRESETKVCFLLVVLLLRDGL